MAYIDCFFTLLLHTCDRVLDADGRDDERGRHDGEPDQLEQRPLLGVAQVPDALDADHRAEVPQLLLNELEPRHLEKVILV